MGLAIFNLLPVPPLDGSRLVNHLLPRGLRGPWERLERVGPFLAFGLLAFLRAAGVDPLGGVDLVVRAAAGVAQRALAG